MKQLKNSAPFSMVFCFLLSIFIVFGVNKAFADPQPLPFDFFPGIGDLVWEDIGDTSSCYNNVPNDVLNIDDAHDALDNTDAYDGAWMTAVGTTNVIPNGTGDLTGNTYTAVTQRISRLDVTYQLYFSADTQCNRLVLFFENPLNIPVSETVRIATDFGSDGSTQVDGTSSGGHHFHDSGPMARNL